MSVIGAAALRFESYPSAALSGLLLLGAAAIIAVALFVQDPWIKAIALAYIMLP